jgi:5,10-methylenetetrahydromethanopterin reductase
MGLDAIKLAEMEDYIRVVYALLREETVEAQFEGQRRKIRFLNPELGLINTKDPIPLHVSAYGPRARAFVAKMGAGWVNFVGDVKSGCAALEDIQANWVAAGHARSDLSAVAFAVGCVLAPGEPYDSPRAMAQSGPRAALYLHRAADEALAGLRNSSPVDASAQEAVRGYLEVARSYQPEDARYLSNHRGHLLFVRPEERPFITADLIRTSSFTATQTELIERIGAMRDAGYTQFTIQITHGQESAIEDWARVKNAFSNG